MQRIRTLLAILSALLACASTTVPRALALAPGDVIDATKASSVADKVSPGILWCIQNGMNLTVGAYKQIVPPKGYVAATEQYAKQAHLSENGVRLEGYVAGLPFPAVDLNDPNVATKIMWNYYYRPYFTDDYAWRNFSADTGSLNPGFGMTIERTYAVRHFGRLFYNGRLYVDPKPELPNPDGIRYKELTGPILTPFDLKGVGSLSYRFLDLEHQDDTWLYTPTLRRVRRLSTAQRSDSVFGQDTDLDSYYGYSGNIAWMSWRFLGEKEMLGAMHTQSPVQWCPGKGDFAFCDVWEPRKTLVVEGISKLPQYAYSKRILFIDKETYSVLYMDAYDRSGNLWKMWINQWRAASQASSKPGVTVYPDEQLFNPSFVMVDVQLRHATRSWTPTSTSVTGEEEFFNVGGDKAGIPESYYTVAHLVEAGR
jgi:hypothetical protein